MKMIPSRRLATNPGEVWRELKEEGPLVITRDGHPAGILLPTSDTTFFDDLREQVRSRARRAVTNIRRQAKASRRADLSMGEIDEEIRKARRARKRR